MEGLRYKCDITQYPFHAQQISSDGGYQNFTFEINRFATAHDGCGGILLNIDQRILLGMTNYFVIVYLTVSGDLGEGSGSVIIELSNGSTKKSWLNNF